MDIKNSEFKELVVYASIILAVILIFAFFFFGITGIRVAFGILIVSIPFYLILGRFHLADGEQIVFSALLGITIFPSMVYILGLAISFRISMLASFLALILMAFILKR